jgi:mannose-6-phosphate isomerase
MKPYPMKFKPELKERVWGGRALEQFGLTLPEGPIGEAWMVADHPNGTSSVMNGELAGMGLNEIREKHGKEWFGAKARGALADYGKFPLLVKLLDCQDDLSVQVHPNDSYTGLPPGELGKTEMWYILDAKPGAKIIYGLQQGVSREQLAEAIDQNRIMDCLQEVSVAAGDSFYIPAGTVHALGAGVLVAEIQQNSDTVYRLYDYDRPGLDGKPRELHVEDSLNVISYDKSDATRMKTKVRAANEWLTLASSPFFVVEKGEVDGRWDIAAAKDSFTILVICGGSGSLRWADGTLPLQPGESYLLPANLEEYMLQGTLTVLRSYLP